MELDDFFEEDEKTNRKGIIMKMNKKEFDKWVYKMYQTFMNDAQARMYYVEGTIIVFDIQCLKSAMATYNKKSNDKTGIVIAYAKLRGIDMPEVDEEPKFKRVGKDEVYCHVVTDSGKVVIAQDMEEHRIFDNECFENNNYFHSRERAKEVADKMNFLLKLERLHDIYCHDYKLNKNGYQASYCVHFSRKSKKYVYYFQNAQNAWFEETQVYFPTSEIAQKVCDILNEER